MPLPRRIKTLFDGNVEFYKLELTLIVDELTHLEQIVSETKQLDGDLHSKVEALKIRLINLHQFQDLDVFKELLEDEQSSLAEMLIELNKRFLPLSKISRRNSSTKRTLSLEEEKKNIELLKALEQQHLKLDALDEKELLSRIPGKYLTQIGGPGVVLAKFKDNNVMPNAQNIEKIVTYLKTNIAGGNCKDVFIKLMEPETLQAQELTCSELWEREKLYFTDDTDVRRMDALALLLSTNNPSSELFRY